MKCYVCRQEGKEFTSTFVMARNKREKSKYRSLCNSCYYVHMRKKGYVLQFFDNGKSRWIEETPEIMANMYSDLFKAIGATVKGAQNG
jgi:hypothetical protein